MYKIVIWLGLYHSKFIRVKIGDITMILNWSMFNILPNNCILNGENVTRNCKLFTFNPLNPDFLA